MPNGYRGLLISPDLEGEGQLSVTWLFSAKWPRTDKKFLNTVASQKSKLKKNLKKTVNLVGVG